MTATGQRKAGRPATGSVRIEYRADAGAGQWLASRMGRMPREQVRSLNTQAAIELEFWRAVLSAETERIRLTLPQALAVADVLNSPDLEPRIGLGMGTVFAACHEEFRLARSGPGGDISSYGTLHGFDERVLLDYLGDLGPAADLALADAISRWWAEVVPEEDPAEEELTPVIAGSAAGFAMVGLRVTG